MLLSIVLVSAVLRVAAAATTIQGGGACAYNQWPLDCVGGQCSWDVCVASKCAAPAYGIPSNTGACTTPALLDTRFYFNAYYDASCGQPAGANPMIGTDGSTLSPQAFVAVSNAAPFCVPSTCGAPICLSGDGSMSVVRFGVGVCSLLTRESQHSGGLPIC